MSRRRFARLTNGFSKQLENHVAAVGLYVAHYNFCRVHEATRLTPAMSLGITDHPWSIGELLDAALHYEPSAPRRKPRPVPADRGWKEMKLHNVADRKPLVIGPCKGNVLFDLGCTPSTSFSVRVPLKSLTQ